MRALVVLSLGLGLAAAARADSLDVQDYSVVYAVPGMEKIVPRKDLAFAAGRFDLYLPVGAKSPPPVVVFVNGVGADLKDWEIYKSWMRLVAARGTAAVMADARRGHEREDLLALLATLARDGKKLGIDATRLGIWACSANVGVAVPVVMDDAPAGVRAAVVYYGYGKAAKIRADLPVFHVLAGRDARAMLDGEIALRAQAAAAHAPWTMIEEPTLPHAFDAIDTTAASLRTIAMTLAFFDANLQPLPAPPPRSAERDIVEHQYAAEPAEAMRGLEALVAAHPENAKALERLAQMKAQAGDCAGAEPLVARLGAAAEKNAPLLGTLGVCELRAKRYDDAVRALERAAAAGPSAGARYNLACAHALAGHPDQALAALDDAIAHGFTDRRLLETDDDLASLRGTPRFRALVDKLPPQ